MSASVQRPTGAFVGASWAALLVGVVVYLMGLWNSTMPLNEKGYYFTILMYGLFAAVSLQKSVRDRLEGTRVTAIYYALCWLSLLLAVLLLVVGLWNASLASSEKGFYAMASICSACSGPSPSRRTCATSRSTTRIRPASPRPSGRWRVERP